MQGVCTFAMFQTADVLRFSFFIFDKDKNGYIDKDELELFVSTLHTGGITGNIEHALHSIDFNGDGKFDFLEFSALHEKFPTVLYPAFRLQQQMCANVLGAGWWRKKKDMLQNILEDANKKIEKERKKMEKNTLATRTSTIRSEMGLANYYKANYFPKSKSGRMRDYLERMNPEPEVYITKDKEIMIRYPELIKKMGDEQFLVEEEEEGTSNDPNRRAGDI